MNKTPVGGTTTQFLLDGGEIAEEITGSNVTSYVGPGVTEEITSAERTVYHADGLGSTRATTHPDQTVASAAVYDAYGNPVAGGAEELGYVGQSRYYADAETGLDYLKARYYDPATGHFISRDPIGYAGGTNLYDYVNGNPVSYVDPWGLVVSDPGFWEGLIPVWGSGRAMVHDVQCGDYWGVLGNGLLAATDVFLLKSIATGIGKVGVKGFAEVASKEAAERLAANRASGLAFEGAKLTEWGLVKNTVTLTGETAGGLVAVIPESLSHGAMWEAKNMAYVYKTPQLEAMISISMDAQIPFNLIVPEGARVSGPLTRLIERTGGGILH